MDAFKDNQNINDFIEQDFHDIAKWLNSLNAYEFTIIATVIEIGRASCRERV